MNQIIIINEIFQIEKIKKLKISNYQVFAINYEIHKKLDEENISHIIADELLSKKERDELYDFTMESYSRFEELIGFMQIPKDSLLGYFLVRWSQRSRGFSGRSTYLRATQYSEVNNKQEGEAPWVHDWMIVLLAPSST